MTRVLPQSAIFDALQAHLAERLGPKGVVSDPETMAKLGVGLAPAHRKITRKWLADIGKRADGALNNNDRLRELRHGCD